MEKMSEADKMFEELGYKKELGNVRVDSFYVHQSYSHFEILKNIVFYKLDKRISIEEYNATEKINVTTHLTIPELKAINQKCKELRVVR